MSGEMMLFPATVEEFMEQYKVVDRDHALSNGAEFIPLFRMRQWFDHLQAPQEPPVVMGKWIKTVGENGVTSACRCSECGFEDNRYSLFSFCPNCGATMEES